MSTTTDLITRLSEIHSDMDACVKESEDAADLALIEKEATFYSGELSTLAQRAGEKSVRAPV